MNKEDIIINIANIKDISYDEKLASERKEIIEDIKSDIFIYTKAFDKEENVAYFTLIYEENILYIIINRYLKYIITKDSDDTIFINCKDNIFDRKYFNNYILEIRKRLINILDKLNSYNKKTIEYMNKEHIEENKKYNKYYF